LIEREEAEIAAAVEAILFAAGEPVHGKEIAAALGGVDEAGIESAVETIERRYDREGAGLALERVAGGYRIVTRPAVGDSVRRFFRQRNRTRFSPAALETLAIVAYRQPITAPEIQAIRGVDPSAALKSLLERRLVRILGRKRVVGNPILYGTSKQFLVHFGLDRLSDLPSIDEFEPYLEAVTAGTALFPADEEPEADAPRGEDEEA